MCRGCGHPFAPKLRVRSASRYLSRPSMPTASPHLAGHYSGLHPEDQPYQSSIITAQRPVEPEARWTPEPEHIVLPMMDTLAQPVESVPTRPMRQKSKANARRVLLPECAISVLLTIACLAFLLGSSVLAFGLLDKHTTQAIPAKPSIWTNPSVVSTHQTFVLAGSGFGDDSLMLFTYDKGHMFFNAQGYPLETHTNGHGNFTLQLQVPSQWQAGSHSILVTDEAEKLSIPAKIIVQ